MSGYIFITRSDDELWALANHVRHPRWCFCIPFAFEGIKNECRSKQTRNEVNLIRPGRAGNTRDEICGFDSSSLYIMGDVVVYFYECFFTQCFFFINGGSLSRFLVRFVAVR